jgi:phosphoribosylformylglycinamidine synthase PurS subunit
VKARITVRLKDGVLDPQGKAIEAALRSLGFTGVAAIRQGKVFDVDIAESDPTKARTVLGQMAEKLLANTVIETYEVAIDK